MKIALAQINPTVGDFSGNLAKIQDYVTQAVNRHADLVMFPELSVCGYWPADLLEKSSFVEQAEQSVLAIAEATAKSGIAVLCGSVSAHHSTDGKQVSNTAVLLKDGAVVFRQHKMLLPFYDVFDEQRYFEPARQQSLLPWVKNRLRSPSVRTRGTTRRSGRRGVMPLTRSMNSRAPAAASF